MQSELHNNRSITDLTTIRLLGNGLVNVAQRAQYVNSLDSRQQCNKRVVIFSTPRSGSTYFCDQVASTGLVGVPDEWLNPSFLNTVKNEGFATTIKEALNWISSRTTTDNGIFSINIQIHHYIQLKKQGFDILKWGFDDAIYLERKDKLSQSYSLAKARITGQWDQTGKRSDVYDKVNVPVHMILKALSEIHFWHDTFEKNLKQHVSTKLYYEDYIKNPNQILDLIEHLSGCRIDSLPSNSLLEKQRTNNDEAIVEFLRANLLKIN